MRSAQSSRFRFFCFCVTDPSESVTFENPISCAAKLQRPPHIPGGCDQEFWEPDEISRRVEKVKTCFLYNVVRVAVYFLTSLLENYTETEDITQEVLYR